MMTTEQVLKIFEENQALLTGHFLLSSGLHSTRYLQCALVLQHPKVAEALCAELAAKAKADAATGQIDLVIAPALGGVFVAHEDVVTTGGSTREVMEVIARLGGVTVGAGSLIDRSGGAVDLGVPRHALAVLEVPTYKPEECPMCREGSTATKPGSRQ
jgi:orotate phosphoribosyltransferase